METIQNSLHSAASGRGWPSDRSCEDKENQVMIHRQAELNAEFRKRHYIGSQSYQKIFCLPGNDDAQEESKELYEDWVIKCEQYLNFFHNHYTKIVDDFMRGRSKAIIKDGNDRMKSEEAEDGIKALVDKEVLKWQEWRHICETKLHQCNALN